MKRRKFITLSSIGSAALLSSFYIPSRADEKKLKIGLIGAGWYGMVITQAALKAGGVEVAAVCDVDSSHLNDSAEELEKLQGKRPKTFKNYQELLEVKGMDAIFIGTPPHWHALQFIAACEKGFDIYLEKPVAYDIQEGLAMLDASKKAGNIVQVGFQRRQSQAFKKAKEMINQGDLGPVHEVMAQIHYIPILEDTTVQDPPAALDWDAWCGPAPKLDYRPNIGHKAWRLEKEYGNGHLVDWGIHHIDTIRMILDQGMPARFHSVGGLYHLKEKITTPDTLSANMEFAGTSLTWQHRLWGTGDVNREFNNGIFFYGDKATLFASDSRLSVFHSGKEGKREDFTVPTEGMQEKHVEDFIRAVKNKDESLISCRLEDAFQSTASVQLAMISYNTGSLVQWDADHYKITDNPGATALLSRKYRSGYVHP